MSAPATPVRFFSGPATVSFVTGLIFLVIGIVGIMKGNPFLLGLGLAMFMTGLVMKFLRNDAFDVMILTLLVIGVGVGALHFGATKFGSHDDHGAKTDAKIPPDAGKTAEDGAPAAGGAPTEH